MTNKVETTRINVRMLNQLNIIRYKKEDSKSKLPSFLFIAQKRPLQIIQRSENQFSNKLWSVMLLVF